MLVLDDLGDWRGLGTALHLAEAGHEVTVVTSAAVVGGGLFHSAADVPLRSRFSAAGGTMRPNTVVLAWDDEGATVRSTLTGATERLPADTLVIAETPVAETSLASDADARRASRSTRSGTASRPVERASRSSRAASSPGGCETRDWGRERDVR